MGTVVSTQSTFFFFFFFFFGCALDSIRHHGHETSNEGGHEESDEEGNEKGGNEEGNEETCHEKEISHPMRETGIGVCPCRQQPAAVPGATREHPVPKQ